MVTTTIFHLVVILLLSFTPSCLSSTNHHHRHLLHQPFRPQDTFIPPTQPPSLCPQSQLQPKYPFSSSSPSTKNNNPFFPSYPSPPPPPPSPSLATFPANISSLLFPQSSSRKPISKKLIVLSVSIALSALTLIVAILLFLFYCRRRHNKLLGSPNNNINKALSSESLRLFPPNTVTSDGIYKPPPSLSRGGTSNNSSAEFLYLGTLANSRGNDHGNSGIQIGVTQTPPLPSYEKLGSPELHPLPPLPKYNVYTSGEVVSSRNENEEEDDEEEFFSPRGSSGEKDSLGRSGSSSSKLERENFGSRSFNTQSPSCPSSNSDSPVSSSMSNNSPLPPDSVLNFPAPPRSLVAPQSPTLRTPSPPSSLSGRESDNSPTRVSDASVGNQEHQARTHTAIANQFVPTKLPPPPPPPPRLIRDPGLGPPVLVPPSRPILVDQVSEVVEKNEETPKPKLKPLHWDKVRASSDRAMVWDQLKSSSFQ